MNVGLMDGWMLGDEWMNEWIDECWINGWMDVG
jgi:hypothetical protein